MDPKTLVSTPILLLLTLPIATLALPLCMVFVTIYGTYRALNLRLKNLFRPDLHERLNCLTQSYTSNWYGTCNPNITQVFILKGRLTPEVLYQELEHRLRDPTLLKLQQFPVDFGGYYYWKDEEHFSIRKHLKYLSPTVFSKSDLEKLLEKLTHESWQVEKSPWELHVISNYYNHQQLQEHSVVILRAHQCFHDIYQNILIDTVRSPPSPSLSSLLSKIFFFSHALYDLLKLRLKLRYPREWYDQYDQEKVSVKNFRTILTTLPLQDLEDISKKISVNSQSVLQGLVITLLQRSMKNLGFSYFDTISLFSNANFRAVAHFPRSGKDPLANIRKSFKEFQDNQNSTIPSCWHFHQKAVGFVPSYLHRNIIYQPKILLDQVQGPQSPLLFGGLEVKDIFQLGSYPGDSSEGIGIVSYWYKTELTISLSVFNIYFPMEVLENFGELLQQEIRDVWSSLRMMR